MNNNTQTYYEPIKDECEVFRVCHESGLPLLLKGPTGCGKSQFVAHMAEALGQKLIKVSCNEDTSATDLLGRFLIQQSETVWQDGPVTRALREGCILYLDEIAEAREDVIVVLHSLTDHRREIYLDRTGEEIKAPKNFMCVASFNPGYQNSLKELKPSTRQRFITMEFDYPPEQLEKKIIQYFSTTSPKNINRLVEFANKIRKQPELGLQETVSTRLLVHSALMIQGGLHPRRACEVSISHCLSDDPKSVDALNDLVALSF